MVKRGVIYFSPQKKPEIVEITREDKDSMFRDI